MNRKQAAFPPPEGQVYVTDGGLETSLIFLDGIDLPAFAAFPLLLDEAGRARLDRYFEPFIQTARAREVGFILNTPTWRANPEWGAKLGYTLPEIVGINRRAVEWARSLAERFVTEATPIRIDGVVGPRGDGYRPGSMMSPDEAQAYHTPQIRAFRDAGADMTTAYTLIYAEEAIGIARAAKALGIPVVISFTVETDGTLASGETLCSALERTDRNTDAAPLYYMVNCAHPAHVEGVFAGNGAWLRRILGFRPNASPKSHAELDEATVLDAGDPAELARRYRALRSRLPHLSILGGCCGTDHRHIAAICDACLPGMPGSP